MSERDAYLLWLMAKDFGGATILVILGGFLYWRGLDMLAAALQNLQGY